jgi:phosphoribosylanthranilate isomerase
LEDSRRIWRESFAVRVVGSVSAVTFTVLPAVDVTGGRVARADGDGPGSPREAALGFQGAGAGWIHLVDLDAAFGRGSNAELLASLIGELDVKVELAGGIDDDDSLERALATGCERVVLSTAALDRPGFCERAIAAHADRIAVSLDVRVDETSRHLLSPRGARADGGDLWEIVDRIDRAGCARYVVTDVSRDGALAGPNIDLYQAVTRATTTPLLASGGIATLDDLVRLADLAATSAHLEGAIVGAALHAGRFSLADALDAVRPGIEA